MKPRTNQTKLLACLVPSGMRVLPALRRRSTGRCAAVPAGRRRRPAARRPPPQLLYRGHDSNSHHCGERREVRDLKSRGGPAALEAKASCWGTASHCLCRPWAGRPSVRVRLSSPCHFELRQHAPLPAQSPPARCRRPGPAGARAAGPAAGPRTRARPQSLPGPATPARLGADRGHRYTRSPRLAGPHGVC